MAKFILFLDRLINLYLYFVIGACLLSWVPNINPNYPLFNFIFKAAGFYILPPFMGMSFSPAIVMVVCTLISMGLGKIFSKYFAQETPEVFVITQEELLEKIKEHKEQNKEEDKENDCN